MTFYSVQWSARRKLNQFEWFTTRAQRSKFISNLKKEYRSKPYAEFEILTQQSHKVENKEELISLLKWFDKKVNS